MKKIFMVYVLISLMVFVSGDIYAQGTMADTLAFNRLSVINNSGAALSFGDNVKLNNRMYKLLEKDSSEFNYEVQTYDSLIATIKIDSLGNGGAHQKMFGNLVFQCDEVATDSTDSIFVFGLVWNGSSTVTIIDTLVPADADSCFRSEYVYNHVDSVDLTRMEQSTLIAMYLSPFFTIMGAGATDISIGTVISASMADSAEGEIMLRGPLTILTVDYADDDTTNIGRPGALLKPAAGGDWAAYSATTGLDSSLVELYGVSVLAEIVGNNNRKARAFRIK